MSWILILFGAGYYFIYGCAVLGALLVHFVIGPLFFDIDVINRRTVRYYNWVNRRKWVKGLSREKRDEFLEREAKVKRVVHILKRANKVCWYFGGGVARFYWNLVNAERYRDFYSREMLGANYVRNSRVYNDCELEAFRYEGYGIFGGDDYVFWIPAWRPPTSWVPLKSALEIEMREYGAWDLYQTDPVAGFRHMADNKAWHKRQEEERKFARAKDHLRTFCRDMDIKIDIVNGNIDWEVVSADRNFNWAGKMWYDYYDWAKEFKAGKYESTPPFAPIGEAKKVDPPVAPVSDKKKTFRLKLPDGVMYLREGRL